MTLPARALPRLLSFLALCVVLAGAATARAGEVHVAVAANFTGTLKALSADFTKKTSHSLVIVSGATGKLYAQVQHGAPFDVFLSADEATPVRLEREGLAVPSSRFTYAVGRLVLFSSKPGYVDASGAVLRERAFAHLAIANPKLAPYGAGAISVLERLGLLDAVRPKLVRGESIAQAFEFVASGNAELGFVALSQVLSAGKFREGSYWLVPQSLYAPLHQDAVVLKRAANNVAARALVEYLKAESTRAILARYGYGVPGPDHSAR